MRNPYNPGGLPLLPHPSSIPSEPLLFWSHHPIAWSLLNTTGVHSRGATLDIFISSLPQIILLLYILISSSPCSRMHNCFPSASPNSTKKVCECMNVQVLFSFFFLSVLHSVDERCFTSSKHSWHYLSSTQDNQGNLATIFFPWQKKRLITLMKTRVN